MRVDIKPKPGRRAINAAKRDRPTRDFFELEPDQMPAAYDALTPPQREALIKNAVLILAGMVKEKDRA